VAGVRALLGWWVAASLVGCAPKGPSSADRYASFVDQISTVDGAGLGVAVERGEDGHVRVQRPLHLSAACDGGIRAGDRLLATAGVPVAGRSLKDVVASLSGQAGSEVTLQVASPPDLVPRTVTLRRRRASLVPIESSLLPHGIGYLRIHYFVPGVAAGIESAIRALQLEAASGWILDLRDNEGGGVDDLVESAGLFLPAHARVGFTLRDGHRRELRSERPAPGPFADLRRAVVVNEVSAAGAELFAASVASPGGLVGTATAGAGGLSRVIRGSEGQPVLEEVGQLADLHGRPLQGAPLVPDLVVVEAANESCASQEGESLTRAAAWLRSR
jgi:carboxyl-terminal processing protease